MSRYDTLAGALEDRWSICAPTTRGRVGRPPAIHADVLFVGVSVDAHVEAVAREVQARGRTVSTVHADIDFAGGLNLALRPPATVAAHAVLWRSTDFTLPIPHHGRQSFVAVDPFDPHSTFHGHAHREAAAAAQCWVDFVDATRWVNEPWAARRADSKALQLRLAAQHGLATPRTIVTADVATLSAFADECGGTVVHKSMQHPMTHQEGGTAGFLHTSTLSAAQIAGLGSGLPYSALFQERLHATAEHRATVVGERVLAARLQRNETSEPDWRRDLASGTVVFAPTALDPQLEASLVALVAELGLVYATVDLLETYDGTLHFLEINPSGSYLWFESITGLPITGAVADELLRGSG